MSEHSVEKDAGVSMSLSKGHGVESDALTYSAACIGTGREHCDWTAEGPGADLAARKHTEAERHGTTTHARPEGGKR